MSTIVHQVPYTGGADGQVYPITDRRMIDFNARGDSGVVEGCEVTNPSGATLLVASGWGVASGCVFTVASESITATLSPSGTKLGELILSIDTSAGTATWITTAVDTPTTLQEDDLTAGDGVYQILFATYDVDTIGIANLTETYPTLAPATTQPFDLGIDGSGNYGYIKIGESTVTPFDPWDIAVPRGYALTSNNGIQALSGGAASCVSAYGAYIISNVGGLGYTSLTRTNGNGSVRVINYDGTTSTDNSATQTISASVKWVICHRTSSSQAVLSISFS